MVEPGIEPRTSWLVVRSSDHQTTRLVWVDVEEWIDADKGIVLSHTIAD
jgi:hypothetical protein